MARKPPRKPKGAAPDRPAPKPLYEDVVLPEDRPVEHPRGGYGGDDDIDERYRYSAPDFSPLHDRRPYDARLGGHAELVCEPRRRTPRRR